MLNSCAGQESVTVQSVTEAPIAVLVKTFPKLSETFILGELLALRSAGVNFCIVALAAPREKVEHPALKALMPSVHYVSGGSRFNSFRRAIGAHIAALVNSPRGYWRSLFAALTRQKGDSPADFLPAVVISHILRQTRAKHLYAHFISRPAAIAELVKEIAGTPYSVSAHAKDIYLSDQPSLRRKLQGAEFTVTCTQTNRDYLQNVGGPRCKIRLMYHGIDTQRLHRRADENVRVLTPRPVILSVGRLREKKGFPDLIAACQVLRNAGVEFLCRIVGYGPERQRLQDLIERLDLRQHVQLVGRLDHADVVREYEAASVFVLPCRVADDGDRDGIPNVLLEAMAMELPVISTSVSGIPEVLRNGVNGLMVNEADVQQLAQAIGRVINDAALGGELGKAARCTVLDMFAAQHNIRTVCELLRDSNSSPRAMQALPHGKEKAWATR